MTEETQPNRRWWPKLLLASLATLAALLAGELLVRWLDAAPRVRRIRVMYNDENSIYQLSENPLLGYELKPNYRNDNPDYGFTCASTNSHGQHDVERKVEKPEGVRRVILLGDSVVEGTEIRELDGLMNRQLEKLYSDGKTEVLNFGVGGYCTLGEVELLKVKGLKFQPDIVIVVFVWNDFENFNSSIVEALRSPEERPSWLFDQLFLHSALFRLACVQLNVVSSNLPGDPASGHHEAIGDNNVVEALARLRDMSREHGFQAALAIWPTFGAEEIRDRGTMPDSDELIVERIARSYGIPTFRLSEYFKRHQATVKSASNANEYYSIGDSMHPNALGCKVAAEALREVIEQLPESNAETNPAGQPPDQRAVEMAMKQGQKQLTRFDLATAMCWAARSHLHSGNFELAIAHFEQALEIDPTCFKALQGMASIHVLQRDARGAEPWLRKALEVDPESAETHYRLGTVLVKLGNLDEAESCLHQALRIKPKFAPAHFGLAAVYDRQGRPAEAQRHRLEGERIEADSQPSSEGSRKASGAAPTTPQTS